MSIDIRMFPRSFCDAPLRVFPAASIFVANHKSQLIGKDTKPEGGVRR